ncbi:hypothetical protein Klosneuvirus_3_75 [Klosneuvirus KNV1]|uniref:Uncharacterized protein n=1 Tax=Klosneuvirus KNV1 TaxID=1977640 RepID=A0A1V0SJN2_9VIRU|nr:hypothetical protein Klosneuvirus_3_75 [Klosneuvirus KNV1]
MDKLTELQELVKSAQGHGDSLYNKKVKKYATELRKDLQAIAVLCKEQRAAVLEFQKSMPAKVKKAGEATEDDDPADDAEDADDDAEDADDGDDEPVEEVKEVKSAKKPAKKEAEKAPEPAKPAAKAPPKKK